MAQQGQMAEPDANTSQIGDGAYGSGRSAGAQDSQADVAHPPQSGDPGSSAGVQDLQKRRLVIDMGDNKTIEITLMGNILLRENIDTQPAAGGDAAPGNAAAPERHTTTQQAEDDRNFLDQMRGWLMTVAALFVGMAFQAAIQPPTWFPKDWSEVFPDTKFGLRKSRTWTITGTQATMVSIYSVSNAVTFGTGLALLVMLLTMKKSPPTRTLRVATLAVICLAITATLTFAVGGGVSDDQRVPFIVIVIILLYALCTGIFLRYMR